MREKKALESKAKGPDANPAEVEPRQSSFRTRQDDPYAFREDTGRYQESRSSSPLSDNEPDVEDLESSEICPDNHTNCIRENIDCVLEVFDEKTCLNFLSGYYEVAKDMKLDEDNTKCTLSGCEFDYSSNTYRLMVELSNENITFAEHFLVIKIDGSSGQPKILSIR